MPPLVAISSQTPRVVVWRSLCLNATVVVPHASASDATDAHGALACQPRCSGCGRRSRFHIRRL